MTNPIPNTVKLVMTARKAETETIGDDVPDAME